MKWLVIALLVLSAILIGFTVYKVNLLAVSMDCLIIPADQKQINERACDELPR